MKKSGIAILSFLLLLLFYFWRNILFWNSSITYKVHVQDVFLFVALVLILIVSLIVIYSYKHLIPNKGIHRIAFLWFFGMLVVLIYNHSVLSAYLKCLLWPILFEVIYILTLCYRDFDKKLRYLFLCLLVLGLFYFIGSLLFLGFELASNMIYFVLLTVPMLLATKPNDNNYIFLLIITILAFLSMKRSMILALALFWVIHLLVNQLRKGNLFKSILLGVFLAIVAVFAYNYSEKLSGGNISRRMVKEDVTNGREAIYDLTKIMIQNSSLDHKILGNGHNAVRRDSVLDISAHNEWLEVIYDYGYIMLVIYFMLWVYMIAIWIKLFRSRSPYLDSYTFCLCVWSVMSMVSQLLLYVSYVIYLFIFLAYIEARMTLVSREPYK